MHTYVGIGIVAIVGILAGYLLFVQSPQKEAVLLSLDDKQGQIQEIPSEPIEEPNEYGRGSLKPIAVPQDLPADTLSAMPAPEAEVTEAKVAEDTGNSVIWNWNHEAGAWKANGTPPACPEPLTLRTPVDMQLVVAALWPGQPRGNDYKGHGGFRFEDESGDDISVYAPIGSHLVQASQYLESGDKQYLLFFSGPCGFFYRFDHVRILAPDIASALATLPQATEGDSRTTYINPPLWVDEGALIGTSVGVHPSNAFIDFGLYDVRKPNGVTPNPAWAELFNKDIEFGHYGVCFFDYLPAEDGAKMRALPTGKEGKPSDYCK